MTDNKPQTPSDELLDGLEVDPFVLGTNPVEAANTAMRANRATPEPEPTETLFGDERSRSVRLRGAQSPIVLGELRTAAERVRAAMSLRMERNG